MPIVARCSIQPRRRKIDIENHVRVFTELPKDQRNSTIDETSLSRWRLKLPTIPKGQAEWAARSRDAVDEGRASGEVFSRMAQDG